MAADGSVIIDTHISTDGMEKGFERLKDEMGSVSDAAEKVGANIQNSFSQIDVSKPIAVAQSKIKNLEQQLATTAADYKIAISEDDDKSAERLASKMTVLYDRIEAARERLAIEVSAAAQKQAAAEQKAAQKEADAAEKASQKAIKAAEKEAAAKAKATEKQFKSMTKPVQQFNSRLREMISGALVFNLLSSGLSKMTSYFGDALKSNKEFSHSLAQLKGALLTAFQPIYEVVLPALLYLMQILTAVVQLVGNFFAAITGKSSDQMAENAKALYDQANATESAGNAAEKAQKQIMGFDEVNKLSDTSASAGGGSASSEAAPIFEQIELTDDLKHILYLVGAIGAALLGWKIASMFTDNLSAIAGIAMAVAGAILFAFNWVDAFANGIDWTNLAGMLAGLALVVGGLALAFGATGAAIGLLVGGIALVVLALYEWITTGELSNEACTTLVIGIVAIGAAISLLTGNIIPLAIAAIVAFVVAAVTKGQELKAALDEFSSWLKSVFCRDWTEIFGGFLGTQVNLLVGVVGGALGGLKESLFGLIDFLQGVFTGDWEQAWAGIGGIVKGTVNGTIGIINGMISAVVGGINSLFRLLSFSIELPDGGSIGWTLPQFTAPQIPYLAQGAVIPPNAPFMAVLGDQTNGNNIEAPEDLIRRIVREESGNGNNEELAELLEILIQTVQGIKVGDEVIGRAAARYQRKTSRATGV